MVYELFCSPYFFGWLPCSHPCTVYFNRNHSRNHQSLYHSHMDHLISSGIFTAFALMIAIYYAPIIHVNHPASNEKRQKAKKQAIAIIIFESILAFILYPYHSEISCAIITGLSVALFMAVLVICINFKSRTGGSITP